MRVAAQLTSTAAYMVGLSVRERHVIQSLVELTRQLEDVDREFTAQMLSMEYKMTGALVNYSKSLHVDEPEENLSSHVSTASISASELSYVREAPAKPHKPQPHRLVNDLVLLDRGQLSPSMTVAVGNVDRSAPELQNTEDDPDTPRRSSGDSGNSSPASPLIATPNAVVNVSASPAPLLPLTVDREGDKPSDLGSVSYFDYQLSVKPF